MLPLAVEVLLFMLLRDALRTGEEIWLFCDRCSTSKHNDKSRNEVSIGRPFSFLASKMSQGTLTITKDELAVGLTEEGDWARETTSRLGDAGCDGLLSLGEGVVDSGDVARLVANGV